jgi:hypothetical protein
VQNNSNDLSLTPICFTGSHLAKTAWVFCKRETISKSVQRQTGHMGAANAMKFPSSLQQILVLATACTLLNHWRICEYMFQWNVNVETNYDRMFAFGLFPGVCSLNGNVSEHSVHSIFIGEYVRSDSGGEV